MDHAKGTEGKASLSHPHSGESMSLYSTESVHCSAHNPVPIELSLLECFDYGLSKPCLLYTSDAADDWLVV